MRTRKVLHYDAFTSKPHMGNPAGVVLQADDLDEESMQSIAKSVGFNETVFVLKSNRADFRLKYFTPGHEMNLCGHATIGSMYSLKTLGFIEESCHEVTIETNVGVLPITFNRRNAELMITMKQDQPHFVPFRGSVDKLAESIGLPREDIDDSMPIVYGSTGAWTLLIPIKNLKSFSKMKPKNELFPNILTENPRSSIHPFALETFDQDAMMHARHFSSPYSGTKEDAVTGTASGVMGAYDLTYLNKDKNQTEFTVEQGHEINKDGRVYVKVIRSGSSMDVFISGTGVFVREMDISYA